MKHGNNNDLRAILGNDVAIKAYQSSRLCLHALLTLTLTKKESEPSERQMDLSGPIQRRCSFRISLSRGCSSTEITGAVHRDAFHRRASPSSAEPRLRHAAFLGFRIDKAAKEVRREP
jgi:hypothetical protein